MLNAMRVCRPIPRWFVHYLSFLNGTRRCPPRGTVRVDEVPVLKVGSYPTHHWQAVREVHRQQLTAVILVQPCLDVSINASGGLRCVAYLGPHSSFRLVPFVNLIEARSSVLPILTAMQMVRINAWQTVLDRLSLCHHCGRFCFARTGRRTSTCSLVCRRQDWNEHRQRRSRNGG